MSTATEREMRVRCPTRIETPRLDERRVISVGPTEVERDDLIRRDYRPLESCRSCRHASHELHGALQSQGLIHDSQPFRATGSVWDAASGVHQMHRIAYQVPQRFTTGSECQEHIGHQIIFVHVG